MQDLLSAARAAKDNAYAPYSGIRIGAAVRGTNGGIHVGCNVENVAYPLGTCAEAAAVCAMVAAGETRIAEILVVSGGDRNGSPCGGCRQILAEFAAGQVPVHLCNDDGLWRTFSMEDLLPIPFGGDRPE